MNKTPLRYPGGKSRFTKFFIDKINIENRKNAIFVEPYCGGAGVAMNLLIGGFADRVYLNDFDRSIYAFWHSILNYTDKFINKIRATDVNISEWKRQKKIQRGHDEKSDLFQLGFSTFFLNRTNYSGIISGGPIGGYGQSGFYKLNCRFNKEELIGRIRLISTYKNNIKIYNKDAVKFLGLKTISNLPVKNTIFYIDPPYYFKGPMLYKNNYSHADHTELSELIKKRRGNHVVSYDDVKEIRELYGNQNLIEKQLRHYAGRYKMGQELIYQINN